MRYEPLRLKKKLLKYIFGSFNRQKRRTGNYCISNRMIRSFLHPNFSQAQKDVQDIDYNASYNPFFKNKIVKDFRRNPKKSSESECRPHRERRPQKKCRPYRLNRYSVDSPASCADLEIMVRRRQRQPAATLILTQLSRE